jgi:hypothetical protein
MYEEEAVCHFVDDDHNTIIASSFGRAIVTTKNLVGGDQQSEKKGTIWQ